MRLHAALPKAILVNDMSEYLDVLTLKESGEVAYIHEDNAKTLKYGMFEGDTNPNEMKAWSVYDLLYLDVPPSYETALSMIAKGEYESAQKLLERCGNDKTPSKKLFRLLGLQKLCPTQAFSMCCWVGDNKKAIELFKKIDRNQSAHARMSVLKEVLPVLVKEKEASDAYESRDRVVEN